MDDPFENLLCDEDPEFIFSSENNHNAINQSSPSGDGENPNFNSNNTLLPRVFGLPKRSEESLMRLFDIETDFMPSHDYMEKLNNGESELGFRNDAIAWISKACACFEFGPMCAYLSVNYFDRFLSVFILPFYPVAMMQFLMVTCFYIASKVEKNPALRIEKLRIIDAAIWFCNEKIQVMEELVLNKLNWRMHSITPYSFIDYFLSVISNGEPPLEHSVTRSENVILDTLKDIDYLEFKPSEIAAAVAIFVSGEIERLDIDTVISSFPHVEKVCVERCFLMLNRKVQNHHIVID